MMYVITLVCAVSFTAWLMNKGAHWWDDEINEQPIDGFE